MEDANLRLSRAVQRVTHRLGLIVRVSVLWGAKDRRGRP